MADSVLYSWEFLGELVNWSRMIAVGAALAGAVLTRDYRVPVSIALAAAVDIVTIQSIAARARKVVDQPGLAPEGLSLSTVAGNLFVRLASKAVLLLAAVVFPSVFDFWGMVAGVLVVDTTILIVGTTTAAVRTFGSGT